MEPSIPVGSMVIVKSSQEYRVGDVITFGADTQGQIPTTHRIAEVREEDGRTRFVTKGDANEVADPETTALRDVIGKVLFSVPYAGYVLDFARTPLGFGVLIGIPATIVILEEVGSIVREVRRLRVRKRRRRRERDTETAYEKTALHNREEGGEDGRGED